MATRLKVGTKHQITLPSAVRKRLHIKPGDHLLVDVRDSYVILMLEPQNYSQHLKGLHPEV